jgi:endonuclease/exonuclease/phosphatase family metal-dependent hydrolase
LSLHHALGRAVIDLGGREVSANVVHVEAYDQDGTKQRQLQQVFDLIKDEPRPLLVGGDFNELPPTAAKIVSFDDEHPKARGTEFEQPAYTPEVMRKFYDRYLPAIDLGRYGATEDEQRRYYSHSVAGPDTLNAIGQPGFWNRTLDYLFVDRASAWAPGSTDVLQSPGRLGIRSDPMRLSDHAPVVGVWELPK